jgi:hypothetical protein
MIMFKMLYSNKGSLLGQVSLTLVSTNNVVVANRAQGSFRWYKTNMPTSTPRSYPTGIAFTALFVSGNYYSALGTNKIVMGLPNVAGNAYLDFAEGGLGCRTLMLISESRR